MDTSKKVVALSKAGDNANKRALQNIRARIIEVEKKATPSPGGEPAPGKSKAMEDDPLTVLVTEGKIIEPPFDMLVLAMLPEHNSELNPCVEAMETNIEGFGHRLVSRVEIDGAESNEAKKLSKEVKKERTRLNNFFTYASIDYSFTEFRRRLRKDMETTGNGYFEVIRNAANKVQAFNHLPSYQMRLGALDGEPELVKVPILELQEDGSVKVSEIKVWKRFRRFIQMKYGLRVHTGHTGAYELRWFKEWGDPRTLDYKTGEWLTGDDEKKAIEEGRNANEVVHRKLYSPRSPYGLPRFVGNLLAIYGDRAAEEINYVTFRNNNIPSMMLLVSNGQLTEGTIARIESFVESQIQGSDNYSKFLILEAEGLMEGEEGGQVKFDAKPMVTQQHKDALFQNYSKNNQDRVRRAFRLPPIFVGATEDYTRTTAETSRRLADEQIFAPERDEFDSWVNRILFPEMGVIYHRFKSNSPNTTDNQELVKILAGAEKTGGMTPRIARLMLEDILGIELPEFPAEFNPDVPFSLVMAEAVKNKADPTEPGQQVTALKAIQQLTEGTPAEGISEDEIVEKLLRFRRRLEKEWREHATELGNEEE
jgi:PBSX family phage portal protein